MPKATPHSPSINGVFVGGLFLVLSAQGLHLLLASWAVGGVYPISALRFFTLVLLAFFAARRQSHRSRGALALLSGLWGIGSVVNGLRGGSLDSILVGFIMLSGTAFLTAPFVGRYLAKLGKKPT